MIMLLLLLFRCSAQTVAPVPRSKECASCPGKSTPSRDQTACECEKGQYASLTQQTSGASLEISCLPCPSGANWCVAALPFLSPSSLCVHEPSSRLVPVALTQSPSSSLLLCCFSDRAGLTLADMQAATGYWRQVSSALHASSTTLCPALPCSPCSHRCRRCVRVRATSRPSSFAACACGTAREQSGAFLSDCCHWNLHSRSFLVAAPATARARCARCTSRLDLFRARSAN